MALLHCSAALLAQLDATPGAVEPPASAPGLLGNWYATKFALDTRQAVLFASQRTFLSFIVLEGRRFDAGAVAACFRGGLGQVLNMEGYAAKVADRIVDSYSELVLAKSASASVTAQKNHLSRAYKHSVRNVGGLEHCDVGDLIRNINHRPRKDLDFATPREATASVLGQKTASTDLSRWQYLGWKLAPRLGSRQKLAGLYFVCAELTVRCSHG